MRRLTKWLPSGTPFSPKRFLDVDGQEVPVDADDVEDRAVDVLLTLDSGEDVVMSYDLLVSMIEASHTIKTQAQS